jgi:hemolysin activation/secretion protein
MGRRTGTPACAGAVAIAVALICVAVSAHAQQIFGPGQERPPLPPPPEEPGPRLELPPIPAPTPRDSLSHGLAVFVRAFAFEGNTAISSEELARATAPFTGRAISSEELLRAADAVTSLYAERGYLTSGALVPDQSVADGVVHMQIVEGRLTAIEVTGNHWFREGYFTERLRRAGAAPVSVPELERALRLLQRSRYVERLTARLDPGGQLGESVLRVEIEERPPYDLAAEVNNEHSPAIGAIGGRFTPSMANLLGHADELRATFDTTEGLFEWDASYEVPINSYDTRLRGFGRESDADVVEAPFDDLGIHSDASTYGVGIAHPLYRDEIHEFWIRASGERRKLESCLEILPPVCEPFSFLAGQAEPTQVASVLRLAPDWSRATSTDVIAARMTFSTGVDVWGATTDGSADAQFFAWLGQAQWAHRFPDWGLGSELVAKVDLQVADDSLLTLEKLAIGGQRTVRGYRENEIVRDNGVVGSLELRIPLVRTGLGRSLLDLVPFGDIGHGWDAHDESPDRTLASLGVGVRLSPWPWLRGELYWGGRLSHVERTTERDLQDDGIHFRVTLISLQSLIESTGWGP